ncbi:hypothetical protein [Paenibacillus sp. FSL M8-0142]|uniref:hypothetical protein n=1 Tax=Paenibacillus sp. FSL M8-0142 TaxID=2954525 RepID=UPI003159A41C
MFLILLGIMQIAFGWYAFRNPDSDWMRMLARIPEDVEQDDVDLFKSQIVGIIAIFMGVIMILSGLSYYSEKSPLQAFIASLVLGGAGIASGLYALLRPESRWFKRRGEDGEDIEPRIWLMKLAGITLIGISILTMLLSAQHLFV